eukprot:NODE_7107_length_587_cov_8.289963_g6107_i0.p1 GENE.NODE_7107_length_587_cov_8.289963_g6107_i0~~NODE_7107_length_587_cov_8.289963_g6107_i0.p1  ORF type:complete len:79 (-),score=10.90 NODE_7107_length_587_cov_8.289963_g6107_i0:183-419(-)
MGAFHSRGHNSIINDNSLTVSFDLTKTSGRSDVSPSTIFQVQKNHNRKHTITTALTCQMTITATITRTGWIRSSRSHD